MVIGLRQLIRTVGKATATTMGVSDLHFVDIEEQKHALDYIPDDNPFWSVIAAKLLPEVVSGLSEGEVEETSATAANA